MPSPRFRNGHTANVRHGHAATGHVSATYRAWFNAKARCIYPDGPSYSEYGGRGIKMCDRWLNSFDNFLADMGERPDGMTLDRKDTNGDYSPDNCRWLSNREQQWNRRNNHTITYNGETLCVAEWAERIGIKAHVLHYRLSAGWPIERTMTKPAGRYVHSGKYIKE